MIRKYYTLLANVLKINLKILRDYPRVFLPFTLRATASIFFLIFTFLSVNYPFAKMLGPTITGLYGKTYLHYPYNFSMMPQAFSDLRLFVINPFFSTLAAAICCGMVYDFFIKREPGFWRNFNKAMRRFFILFPCMVILLIFNYVANKILTNYLINIPIGPSYKNIIILLIIFLVFVLIEIPFAFCFIAIMAKRRSIFSAFKESFSFSFKLFPVVFVIIFVSRLIDLGANLLLLLQPYLAEKFIPDVIALVLLISIILAVISDTLVYSLCSCLYCLKENVK